jgi:hypothetical protein
MVMSLEDWEAAEEWEAGFETASGEIESLRQQLANMTAERDAEQSRVTAWLYAEGPDGWITKLRQQLAVAEAAIKVKDEALQELDDLIGETSGVYGLHLNGDPSPWGEIIKGGRFERLSTLPEALAATEPK